MYNPSMTNETTHPADKILRYAATIQKMAVNAPFDFEDRELLRQLAQEIEAAREVELQERLTPMERAA